MIRFRTDAKIERLAELFELDRRTARGLAAAADEVEVEAGRRIGHSRFVHVVVDGPEAGLVVDAGAPPAVLTATATVLVLTRDDARRTLPPAGRDRTAAGAVPRLRPA